MLGKNILNNQIKSIVVNNVKIKNLKEIPDHFNRHFSTVAEDMALNFNDYNEFKKFMPESLNKTILLKAATNDQISKIISSLSNKSFCGIDLISQKLLKIIEPLITPVITRLINYSIAETVYPNCLKIA